MRSDYSAITKHGESVGYQPSPEYRAWLDIKKRCLNPNNASYPRYGGRGITMYEPWQTDVKAFIAHVGRRPSPKHSIDRIDNARGYEPGNVKWSTTAEQLMNRRNTRTITYNGETRCLADWARVVGISAPAMRYRVNQGWSPERCMDPPSQ